MALYLIPNRNPKSRTANSCILTQANFSDVTTTKCDWGASGAFLASARKCQQPITRKCLRAFVNLLTQDHCKYKNGAQMSIKKTKKVQQFLCKLQSKQFLESSLHIQPFKKKTQKEWHSIRCGAALMSPYGEQKHHSTCSFSKLYSEGGKTERPHMRGMDVQCSCSFKGSFSLPLRPRETEL